MLLGYGTGGEYGAGLAPLELPDNVFATEYLTMEGKQFSSSRGAAIYLRDFLDRYDPDPLRYYLVAAGPETQDTDFTWAEFVRRNNDELLANWGNLVNRTLTNAHRNFGAVPEPGELTAADEALLAAVDGGFDTVGAHLEAAASAPRSAETMRLASLVNQYVSDQAPWALVKTDRERAATVLYVSLRAVDSLKTLFTPFLPHTSQRVHELLGYEGWLAGPLEFRDGQRGGRPHPRGADRRLPSWIGALAAERAARRPGAARAEAALPQARRLDRRRRARDAGARDRHPRAPRPTTRPRCSSARARPGSTA